MPDLNASINAARERDLDYPWLDDEDRSLIVSSFGSDVLRSIDEILEFAESHSDLWKQTKATAKVTKLVEAEYPFLSPKAVEQAVRIASYCWK